MSLCEVAELPNFGTPIQNSSYPVRGFSEQNRHLRSSHDAADLIKNSLCVPCGMPRCASTGTLSRTHSGNCARPRAFTGTRPKKSANTSVEACFGERREQLSPFFSLIVSAVSCAQRRLDADFNEQTGRYSDSFANALPLHSHYVEAPTTLPSPSHIVTPLSQNPLCSSVSATHILDMDSSINSALDMDSSINSALESDDFFNSATRKIEIDDSSFDDIQNVVDFQTICSPNLLPSHSSAVLDEGTATKGAVLRRAASDVCLCRTVSNGDDDDVDDAKASLFLSGILYRGLSSTVCLYSRRDSLSRADYFTKLQSKDKTELSRFDVLRVCPLHCSPMDCGEMKCPNRHDSMLESESKTHKSLVSEGCMPSACDSKVNQFSLHEASKVVVVASSSSKRVNTTPILVGDSVGEAEVTTIAETRGYVPTAAVESIAANIGHLTSDLFLPVQLSPEKVFTSGDGVWGINRAPSKRWKKMDLSCAKSAKSAIPGWVLGTVPEIVFRESGQNGNEMNVQTVPVVAMTSIKSNFSKASRNTELPRESGNDLTIASENYQKEEELSTTAFRSWWTSGEELVVVKRINKDKCSTLELDRCRREVTFLNELTHPNILPLLSHLDSEKELLMFFEHAPFGDLHSSTKLKTLSEMDTRRIVKTVLSALDYVHMQGIIHCDVKPQNILLFPHPKLRWAKTVPCDNSQIIESAISSPHLRHKVDWNLIKLCDFGLAQRVNENGVAAFQGVIGTHNFIAPEVLMRKDLSTKVDCFALGVVAYQLLVGYEPFYPARACMEEDPQFDNNYGWAGISDDAKDLIRKLLDRCPNSRLSARQALQHAWFSAASLRVDDF